jgi:putative ABC transport system ATP-binding protein
VVVALAGDRAHRREDETMSPARAATAALAIRTFECMTPIVATGLCKRFGPSRVVALDDVSLRVEPGEWVAVMGPSGCGKSSLLHALGGLDVPDAGTVSLAGEVLTGRSESMRARIRRRHAAYVFQQYNLVEELDVAGNVELPLVLRGVPRRAARGRARGILGELGIVDLWQRAPASLSGGEQQRVALARALVGRPAVVLADEPTGALDSGSAQVVVALLAAAHAGGQSIVMVTHDPAVAAAADRTVHMRDGRNC